MPPTREELYAAIEKVKAEIVDVKERWKAAADPVEERRLKRKLKELQYLQLWQMDMVQNMYDQERKR
ncbi:hypothetical protein V6C27_03075 [Peptococcaceae bacterium 1198_IL3148]